MKALAKERFGSYADRFLELIGSDGDLEKAKEAATVSGIGPAVALFCRRLEELGKKGPWYYYDFGPEIPGWDHPGVFHSVDLWFFFETLAKCWRPFVGKHYDLARQMCNYWANFIRSGDPNGDDADGTPMERWEPYTQAAKNCMTFYEKPKAELQKDDALTDLIVDASLERLAK